MKQVKGTLLLTIVKILKARNRTSGYYNSALSDNAKTFLERRILTGSWYPLEYYRELFDTLCSVDAKNDPKTLIEWGLEEGKQWFTTIYQSAIVEGDLESAIERYKRFHKKVFNFGEVKVEAISDTELEFTYVDMPQDWKNYYYTSLGYALVFIELCVGKKPEYFFQNKSWERGGWTKTRFSWVP
ncbi:MAG: hypothetical protein ACFFCE_04095 [Promethearchaeota archaeon]